LPKRCPLIGKCQRFVHTILLLSEIDKYGVGNDNTEKLFNAGYIAEDFNEKKIEAIGQPFTCTRGPNIVSFNNACPEVSLFDTSIFGCIPKNSIINGDWDDFRKSDKFHVTKEGHYSECAEFSSYQFHNNTQKKSMVKPTYHLYLMQNMRNNYYKIGKSTDPKFREKTLQSEEPEVKLIEIWENFGNLEKVIHKKLNSKRLRGEWFELTDSDINIIFLLIESKQGEINTD